MFLADQMLISFDIRIDQFLSVFSFQGTDREALPDPFHPVLPFGCISHQGPGTFWLLLSHRCSSVIFINKSGSHLLFHTVSSIVPSAVQVLTVVFGMRTGVTPARIATGQTYLFIISLPSIHDNLRETQPLLSSLERR